MSIKSKITVLHDGNNPTSYYWLSHLDPNFVDLNKNLEKKLIYNSNTIIIVRYIPLKYLFDLFKLHRKNTKIILLLDDNLLSLNFFSELPFKYKFKLFFRIYCYKSFLRFFISQIWVTNLHLKSEILSQTNNKIDVKVIDLKPKNILPKTKLFRISYLGTSSHVLELKWIKKLFSKIQSERDDCLIEIFINARWRLYFKSIPRIKMIYPMDWDMFFLDTQNRKVDIVLNPILNSKFNSFRSSTKFFDTTRLGAVGIYSENSPYSSFVKDNYDGLLLDNNINLWCQNIYYLLDNPNKRKYLYLNAIKRTM